MKVSIETHEDRQISVRFGEVTLLEYTYRPEIDPQLCPRPFVHPLRTLDGDIVTNLRPSDHPWHLGLSMTLTDVSEINFWGGSTYTRETGKYTMLPNSGAQLHNAWLDQRVEAGECELTELLDWVGPNGRRIFRETRTLRVQEVRPDIPMYRLIWESELKNVTGEALTHDSYCSRAGLSGSGYTGLFMRMSRGFCKTHERIFRGSRMPEWDDYHDGVERVEPENLNGRKGTRLAYQGVFDTSLNGGLLILQDLTPEPSYVHHWFHRPNLPCIAWSTAFYKTMTIGSDECLRLKHALGVVSGFWNMERVSPLWIDWEKP